MTLSARLARVVDALPLRPGLRVLEVGGAPGTAAREVVGRVAPGGFVLVVDRSPRGVDLVRRTASAEIAAGLLGVRLATVEDFVLEADDAPFDLAFAARVGAFDGRHPEIEAAALRRVADALVPGGRFFVDGGDPLRELRPR